MTEKRFEYNHEKGYKDYIYDVDDNRMMWELDCICELLNALHNENKQLKQRNDNQYNQLNELWQLIESEDWKTLTAMNKQMKEDEERLKREWRCYE